MDLGDVVGVARGRGGCTYMFIMFPRIPWFSAMTWSMLVRRSWEHECPVRTSTFALISRNIVQSLQLPSQNSGT